MSQQTLFKILLMVWAAAFAWSFISFSTAAPTGDGFTRGLNRVTGFLGWQGLATILAVAVWITGRGANLTGLQKWISRTPALMALALVLAVLSLVLWSVFTKPSPISPPPPGPVTEPVQN